MRPSLSTRLEKLETALRPDGVFFLVQREDESRDDCIQRSGYDPGDRRSTFIVTLAAHSSGL